MTSADLARLRSLAFTVAYRMLGEVGQAEDVAQETLLRVDATTGIDNPDAFVTTVATRLSLDVLRSARARREVYVGEWLPEPVVSGEPGTAGDAARHAELADDLSTAFLVLLETLTPAERAAFLLHDVLGYPHDEAAAAIGRSEAATRQLVSRARARIAERRPRFPDSPRRREQLVARFLDACEAGRVQEFVDLLTDDVVFTGDGGGRVPPGLAVSRPVVGREAVGRLLAGFVHAAGVAHLQPRTVNGAPGAAIVADESVGDGLVAVVAFELRDGRICHIRSVINPDKIRHVGPLADLARVAERLRSARRR